MIFSNRYGILPSAWRRIEVVITGLTRNQLNSDVPWVRIPPSPPKTKPPNGGFCFWLLETVGIRTGSVVNEAPVALQSRAHGPPRTAGRIPPQRAHKYFGGGWAFVFSFWRRWIRSRVKKKPQCCFFSGKGRIPPRRARNIPVSLPSPLTFSPAPGILVPTTKGAFQRRHAQLIDFERNTISLGTKVPLHVCAQRIMTAGFFYSACCVF